VRLQGTRFILIDEVLDSVDAHSVHGTWEDELLHILTWRQEANGRLGGAINADEFGKTLLNALGGGALDEVDLTVELLGGLGEDLVVGGVLVVAE